MDRAVYPLCLFFLSVPAPTEIYTLSLHDALPIFELAAPDELEGDLQFAAGSDLLDVILDRREGDRKSTRLNSSHITISYAVFCLKKKNSNNSRWRVTKTCNSSAS